jgi:hypothetical protein
MCKEMPVIPVDRVGTQKRIKKMRAEEEEERHKGLPIPPKNYLR